MSAPDADAFLAIHHTSGATPAEKITLATLGGLEVVTGTDADTAMVAGSLYTVAMSGWATSVRTYTLPTTAKVGSRIGIYITSGNATHELAIRTTAASNDTINGTDYDSADWSKLFITGELVIFRCIVADTDWIVEYDGRIPQLGKYTLATSITTNTAATATLVDYDSGEIQINQGGICDATNNRFIARRAGEYRIYAVGRPANGVSDQQYYETHIYEDASLVSFGGSKQSTGTGSISIIVNAEWTSTASDGTYWHHYFKPQEANKGADASFPVTNFTVEEVL